MINIEDYNFETGHMECNSTCIFCKICLNDDFAKFEEAVDNKFGRVDIPACWRFKITKKIKDD